MKFNVTDLGYGNLSLESKYMGYIIEESFGMICIYKPYSRIGMEQLFQKVIKIKGLTEKERIKEVSRIANQFIQKIIKG